jgi:hypothetical protein
MKMDEFLPKRRLNFNELHGLHIPYCQSIENIGFVAAKTQQAVLQVGPGGKTEAQALR